MNIGTAKPSPGELAAVKHYFINSLSIKDKYTVFDYAKEVPDVLDTVFTKSDFALLSGGSGLFVKAAYQGLDEMPSIDEKLRDDLNQQFVEKGLEGLQKQLKAMDPLYYEEVDLKNHRRLIRALEVCLTTGSPFSSFRTRKPNSAPYHCIKIGLTLDRITLYKKIDARVGSMINTGLVAEARSLLKFMQLPPLQTFGYKELFNYFQGQYDLETAVEAIKKNTRNYAKRQLTWFKKDSEINWFNPNDLEGIIAFVVSKLA